MVLLPQALEYIEGTDASFEIASSSSNQPVMLFYRHKLVTKSIGLVLYHNRGFSNKLEDCLQKKFNVIKPASKMLKQALKLDKVHTFGDISQSQLLEKIDWVTEIAQ